jgi:hypothetical protein
LEKINKLHSHDIQPRLPGVPASRVVQAEAARLPNTQSLVHMLLGSSLCRALSLTTHSWLLDKPPGTGAQEAGNQNCMVEISQFVQALLDKSKQWNGNRKTLWKRNGYYERIVVGNNARHSI